MKSKAEVKKYRETKEEFKKNLKLLHVSYDDSVKSRDRIIDKIIKEHLKQIKATVQQPNEILTKKLEEKLEMLRKVNEQTVYVIQCLKGLWANDQDDLPKDEELKLIKDCIKLILMLRIRLMQLPQLFSKEYITEQDGKKIIDGKYTTCSEDLEQQWEKHINALTRYQQLFDVGYTNSITKETISVLQSQNDIYERRAQRCFTHGLGPLVLGALLALTLGITMAVFDVGYTNSITKETISVLQSQNDIYERRAQRCFAHGLGLLVLGALLALTLGITVAVAVAPPVGLGLAIALIGVGGIGLAAAGVVGVGYSAAALLSNCGLHSKSTNLNNKKIKELQQSVKSNDGDTQQSCVYVNSLGKNLVKL